MHKYTRCETTSTDNSNLSYNSTEEGYIDNTCGENDYGNNHTQSSLAPESISICFVCHSSTNLSYAKVCCGTMSFHEKCMHEYCLNQKESNDEANSGLNENIVIKCIMCGADISSKLYIKEKYYFNWNKCAIWIIALYWIMITCSSFTTFVTLSHISAIHGCLIITSYMVNIGMMIFIINEYDSSIKNLFEWNNIDAKIVGFFLEFINPTILFITSGISHINPSIISGNTASFIFICVGISTIIIYVGCSYIKDIIGGCYDNKEEYSVKDEFISQDDENSNTGIDV